MLLLLLLISGIWGMLSPRLFLNGWLAFLGIISTVLAMYRNKLGRRAFFRNIFVFTTEMFFNFILLFAGFYLLYNQFALGRTSPEIIAYWIASTAQLILLLTSLSRRLDSLIERSQK